MVKDQLILCLYKNTFNFLCYVNNLNWERHGSGHDLFEGTMPVLV